MILPEPRQDSLHQKGIAFVSTLIVAGLGFVFLSISDLEIKQTSREIFRQIDIGSLMPQDLKLGQVDEALDGSPGGNSVQLIGQALIDDPGGGAEAASESEAQEDPSTSEDEEAVSPSESSAPVSAPPKPEPSPPANQAPPREEPSVSETPRPNTQPGQPPPATTPRPSTASRPSTTSSSAAPATSSNGGIAKLPLDSFGRNYKDLEVRQIINWMKDNPSELPKGIRQLVRFRPAFLSSVVSFTMEGKQYELYLMCKESLFEVHVVLVEQNEATYLVDRSFQKLSTYLRKGQVRRTQDNQIIAVRSNMASNDSSDEFYALFLSWWEWAQNNPAG